MGHDAHGALESLGDTGCSECTRATGVIGMTQDAQGVLELQGSLDDDTRCSWFIGVTGVTGMMQDVLGVLGNTEAGKEDRAATRIQLSTVAGGCLEDACKH